MKILLISHSTSIGGGEKALIKLTNLLRENHTLDIIFPNSSGDLINHFILNGFNCLSLPLPASLPDFTNYVISASQINFKEVTEQLIKNNYDLVITNTIVAPHGGIIASLLNIPHITYVHEYLDKDADLTAIGISNSYYMQIIESQSDFILCCSNFVLKSLNMNTPASVLYPHDFSYSFNNRNYYNNSDSFNILLVGVKSIRKNTHFSISVLKALRLRGRKIHLHIIGSNSTGTAKLTSQLNNRNEKNITLHEHSSNPYEVIKSGNCISLICSSVEAFGLTITESLQQGIPVVASKSGGPQEILHDNYLYEVNDINKCVRSIERIIDNFCSEIEISLNIYNQLKYDQNVENEKHIVDDALAKSISKFNKNKNFGILSHIESIHKLRNIDISLNEIEKNICTIDTQLNNLKKNYHELITIEINNPGSSVLRDIIKYDVVPFSNSNEMDNLYKNGLGLATELASTFNDYSRIKMAATIINKLLEISHDVKNLEILSIGDGLGIDAIRFASCGFKVDYMDFDNSNMAKIAELNFDSYKLRNKDININRINARSKSYEVVVCLEVIEHIENVFDFIQMLCDSVTPGGYLFISECFDGIKDRWPTHLYINENFSNLLPLILLPYFELIDYSKDPYCKPYIFKRKINNNINSLEIFNTINDKWIALGFINSKNSIGI